MDNASEYTDEQLMLRYADDDADAFEILFHRHKDVLYRFVLRQCQQRQLAEELTQDIWIKLIDARKRYQVTARFKTWLFQIARNRVIDHFRVDAHSPLAYSSRSDLMDETMVSADLSPQEETELSEQLESLVSRVESLPQLQREAFLLRFEADMSVPEIAETTGVNEETAKSRLRYALNRIRQLNSGEYE